MPVNHLLPFALPRGRTGSTGRLTVYFSPRLKEGGRLGRYNAWEDWPSTLSGLSLLVRVNGTDITPNPVGIQASSAVWRAVFAPRTPVAPHRFVDFSDTPRQPMASSDFSERILELYLGMAREHPDGPPGGDALIALATAAGLNLESEGADNSLAEAAAYRAPMKNAVDVDEPVAEPEFDFHASVSLLGHHPELLRHLGLAVDLEVPGLPANPNSVRVTAGFGGGQATEAVLVTRTTADFLALPNPNPDFSEQADGFLRLAAEKAFLSLVDPHLAAARVSAAADSVVAEDSGVLPALATRALSLVRPDLTKTFGNRTRRQAELEDLLQKQLDGVGAPVELFAEDVTIGQRFDVLDQGAWRSLFERRSDAGYLFPRDPKLAIVPAADEGWNTTLLVTEQADVRPGPTDDVLTVAPTALFRLDDAVYRWSGWSGAVPAPGEVLDGATGAPAKISANEPAADQAAQVAVDYEVVPGSLPRLRFGRTYAMRARCVDLAGNSQPLTAKEGPDAAAPPETFGRLEPVAAPVVLRRTPRPVPGVGDNPEVLVLRSDIDVLDQDVAEVDRLLFPGRVGPDLCELHGLPAGGADPGSHAELARRDALDLTKQTVTDPVSGELIAAGAARQEIGYLSDPAIGGVRLGLPGDEVAVDLADTWPKRDTVRLVVAAGAGATEVKPDPDTDVRVFVPKAGIVGVAASFSIADGLLEHFALWQRLTSGDQAELQKQISGGAHWMFTPARPLTLVHAVRRPLLAPLVDDLDGGRTLGSSAVVLDGCLIASTTSTERVTMTATWTDLVDDPTLDAPEPRSTSVELGDLLVTRSDKNEVSVESLRAELHDTKRHLASVTLEAYTSFAAYFTEEKSLTLSTSRVLLDRRGVVGGSVEVTVVKTGAKAEPGADFTVNGPNGTLLRNPRGALPVGAAVRVRYIALPISRLSTEGDAKAFPILLPNTAVPPPPVVAEVIPSLAVDAAEGTRSGQLLRVYLARPWLVTGEGEQLAVIVEDDGSSGSVVGRDPITTGTGRDLTLTGDAFPRATSVVTDGGRTVLAHPVSFDPGSGRWYADVELAAGFGYRPFLQLVVARYQPDSIGGATLSSFVTLEPVRLGVVRSTQIVRRGSLVDAIVKGTRDLDNQIDIRLEQADPSVPDPDLTWQPVGDPVRLAVVRAGEETVWSGGIEVGPAKGRLRVVVEEVEPGRRTEDKRVVNVETVVFVETVELPPL